MAREKPKLRKREIGLALAAGLLAAGGAVAVIDESSGDNERPAPYAEADALTQVDYALTDFDEISTVGPQDVFITQGDVFSVRGEGSSRALGQLEAVVENGQLILRPQEGPFRGDWGSLEDASFHITLPQLHRVALAGTGDIAIDGVVGESFAGVIGGAGEMHVTGLAVDEVEFGIFGAGDLSVAGTAGDTSITIGGAGAVDGEDLFSQTASVSIGGAGEVELAVEQEARISITGSGDVDITGPAVCSVTRMGSGDVHCDGPGGD